MSIFIHNGQTLISPIKTEEDQFLNLIALNKSIFQNFTFNIDTMDHSEVKLSNGGLSQKKCFKFSFIFILKELKS